MARFRNHSSGLCARELGGIPDVEIKHVGFAVAGEVTRGPDNAFGELVLIPNVEVDYVRLQAQVGVAWVEVPVDRDRKRRVGVDQAVEVGALADVAAKARRRLKGTCCPFGCD